MSERSIIDQLDDQYAKHPSTRLAVSHRPVDWKPTGWTSDIRALSNSELASDLSDHRAMVRQLEFP